MINVYKMLSENGTFDKNFPSILTKKSLGLRGHKYKLSLTRANKDIYKYFFSNRVVNDWNSLPENIVMSEDVKKFEKALGHHWGNQDLMFEDFKADIQYR